MTEPRNTPARRERATGPGRRVTKPVMDGAVRMEHMTLTIPEDEPLTIPYSKADPVLPEVQVLSVDRVEGTGFDVWDKVWNVVVIWRS